MKEHRDDAGRQQGEEHISLYLDERTQANDDQHIQSDDAQGERTIHQRAIDDEIDIPQAIAQNGNPNGQRNEHEEEFPDRRVQEPIGRRGGSERRKQPLQTKVGDVNQQSEGEPKDQPFALLSLHVIRDERVAIELDAHRGPPEHQLSACKEQKWPVQDLVGRVRWQHPRNDLDQPEEHQHPRPSWDRATGGKQ
ncbi:MAG: hypothetical protein E6I80_20955 [Chloroflexi bacterium]|nr:MAG: hypothetical protein E6I80_20955 [Chloroflexota bacterium]